MRREVKLAVILALMSGSAAAIVTFDANRNKPEPEGVVEVQGPTIALTTIVVAKEKLEFGAPLTKFRLEEAQWPVASVPPGAFRTIGELFSEQLNRAVLVRLEPGQPVTKDKITGPGQRASLSAMLLGGKKAVSLRVNDVAGVGGFVLPGDRVDILITRKNLDNPDAGASSASFTDVLLENIRVLGVDQTADSQAEAATVARTVTVEVSIDQAQKVTLGQSVGELSLVLREEGSAATSVTLNRMTVADLAGDSGDKAEAATFEPTNAVAAPAPPVPPERATATINVVRTGIAAEYFVKRSAARD